MNVAIQATGQPKAAERLSRPLPYIEIGGRLVGLGKSLDLQSTSSNGHYRKMKGTWAIILEVQVLTAGL